MDYVKLLKVAVQKGLDKTAENIQRDMRAIVAPHSVTHRELTIVIEKPSEKVRRIGSYDRGVRFLNDGNKGVTNKPMSFVPHKPYNGSQAWRNMNPKTGKVYIRNQRGYDGLGFVEDIAKKYNGR